MPAVGAATGALRTLSGTQWSRTLRCWAPDYAAAKRVLIAIDASDDRSGERTEPKLSENAAFPLPFGAPFSASSPWSLKQLLSRSPFCLLPFHASFSSHVSRRRHVLRCLSLRIGRCDRYIVEIRQGKHVSAVLPLREHAAQRGNQILRVCTGFAC